MRSFLDQYVRSLAERELAGDAPQHLQDIGTFMDWLLPKLGYRVHLHSYKHFGRFLRKSAGRPQWGVDIIASKPVSAKVNDAYLFVLKHGDVGRQQWSPQTPGSLPHDLMLAAGLLKSDIDRHVLSNNRLGDIVVVAVHNGDLDSEALGSQVKTTRDSMERNYGVKTAWWDADALVELSMSIKTDQGCPFADRGDSDLFPPSVRPFARLALDSLARDDLGRAFDLTAVDQLLDQALPLQRGGEPTVELDSEGLPEGPATEPLRVNRALSELALFCSMLAAEAKFSAHETTLPVLDGIERVLCRAMEHVRRLPTSRSHASVRRSIRQCLEKLVEQYILQASALAGKLSTIADIPYGLALGSPGDVVDYPLRALRLSGYLATAGLALLELGRVEEAEELGLILERLWDSNEGGVLQPVTNDQEIEIAMVWELWGRLGHREIVGMSASKLLQRMLIRRIGGFPMPAAGQKACLPYRTSDLRVLVEAHSTRSRLPAWYSDSASTIVPLAVYAASSAGQVPDPSIVQALVQGRPAEAGGQSGGSKEICCQSWRPQESYATELYVREIKFGGMTRVHDLVAGLNGFQKDFEAFHLGSSSKTTAEEWGYSCIDRMACKVFRTPVPLRHLVGSLSVDTGVTPPSSEHRSRKTRPRRATGGGRRKAQGKRSPA